LVKLAPFVVLCILVPVRAQIGAPIPGQTPAQKEADIDADDDPSEEADSDNPEARWHYFYDQRVYPNSQFPPDARLKGFRQLTAIENAVRAGRFTGRALETSGQWKLIGPQPINYSAGFVTSGRITGIAVDPRSNDVVYIGTADGGVWKTTDGGAHWSALTDQQPSLAIGSIAIDPSNPDTIYAGTGEENFNADAYSGVGILKSEDAGASWTLYTGPFNRQRIGSLAVHPKDRNILLAASNAGIYRSTDGGQTWTSVLNGAGTSVFFDVNQPDIAWSALGFVGGASQNGVYRSTDAGSAWTRVTGSASDSIPSGTRVGRIEVVPALTSPDTVYAAVANVVISGASLNGIYKTIDAGAHWSKLAAPDFCNPQCWYNLAIQPHPSNPNLIFAGGVGLIRSMNGGDSWTALPGSGNGGGPHVDHHALAFTSDGTRFYDGNDGGIWSTETLVQTPVAWNNLNTTLALTQYYPSLSIHPSDINISLAGSQDNGTHMYRGTASWTRVIGGDGGNTAIDPSSPNTAYGSVTGITLFRTNQSTFSDAIPVVHGIDQADRSRFIGQWILDPANPQTMYYGTYRLYKSVDGGGLWTAISADLTNAPSPNSTSSTYTISTIAVAPADPGVIYTGASSGAVYATRDGGQTWEDRTAGLPVRAVTRVVADPLDPATVYVTLSGFAPDNSRDGHVYRSTDSGRTWTNISGNLPNVPVNDLVVDPDIPDTLYIGTDLGVMGSGDNGASWQTLGVGLPKTAVVSLVLHRPSRTLRAASHGRSVWDFALPPGSGAPPIIRSFSPPGKNVGDEAFTLTINGSNFVAGVHVLWNGSERRVIQGDAASLQVEIPASDLTSAGRASVVVFNPASGGGASIPAKFVIGPAPAAANGGIVSSAASNIPNAAPGSLVSIYGSNLAPGVVQAVGFPLPETLGGVTVTINGSAAPIYFVSPTQINVQIPYELSVRAYSLSLNLAGSNAAPATITIARTAPSLFSLNQTGSGQGAIRIAGTATVAARADSAYPGSRPAHAGEIIEIYCTGLGAVSPSPGTGNAAASGTLSSTLLSPTVTIGGIAAAVMFSGLTPGAAGLYQVNVRIPDGVGAGDQPVVLTIGGVPSNSVTVAIE
jgi:uncharacterized protein (TIGR03437 family)